MALTILDAERRTRYTPAVSTTDYSVGFPIFGDADIEVWHDDVMLAASAYDVQLGVLVDGFYQSANVMLDSGVTGTVDIIGTRAPSRTTQYGEGAAVPATDLNRDQNLLQANLRELFDMTRRGLYKPPGQTIGALPAPATGKTLRWTAGGDLENGPTQAELTGATGPIGATGATGATGTDNAPDASLTVKGKAETATAAEILNDTQNAALFISPQYLNDALAFFGLTETAGAIPIDLDDGLNFSVTIDENSALGNPSNEDGRHGRPGVIKVTAGGANRTIDVGSEWLADVGFTWPLTVNSGATTYLGYVVSATGVFTIIGIAQNVAGT